MRFLHALMFIAFVLVVGAFCVQNMLPVPVEFFGWQKSVPMPLLALVIYLMGMVSGWSVLAYLRRSWERLTEANS